MANGRDNLIPQNRRTKEEQREIAKMGGKASGRARKEKASMRKAAQMILDGTFTDKNGVPFTGLELIQRGLMANIGNPNSRNWGKAMDLLVTLTSAGMSPEQRAQIEAETALIKAKAAAMAGTGEQKNGMLEKLIEGLRDDIHEETESAHDAVENGESEAP